MMRSPHFVAVAVRRPDQSIALKDFAYRPWSERFPLLKWPFLRGVAVLLESTIQGMQALGYSAEVAEPSIASGEGTSGGLSRREIALSMGTAIALALLLFVGLPHLLASFFVLKSNPLFHWVDGIFKMGILLTYVYLISLAKDIYRVFQFHGAEHKSIYTFEAGEELSVAHAKLHSRLHPRCGTSFLLFLVLISIAVFSVALPLVGSVIGVELTHIEMLAAKVILMFPVASISYELIKASSLRMSSGRGAWLFRALVWPGLQLQNLTTREPEDDQIEVALTALRRVLELEKKYTLADFPE